MSLEIKLIPVLNDNYMYLLHDQASGETAAVDPADASLMLEAASSLNWRINKIFVTHKHDDHVAGLLELKEKTGVQVFGPDKEIIAGVDTVLNQDDIVSVGESVARVIETPGHTLGHIVYYFQSADTLITGDALFVLGCGRLFEGTAAQAWGYLQRLRELPAQTQIYCGHEYTRANLAFAQSVDPHNAGLMIYEDDLEDLQETGKPSVPSTMAFEIMMNPFMKADQPSMKQALGMENRPAAEVFAVLRKKKDQFVFP